MAVNDDTSRSDHATWAAFSFVKETKGLMMKIL